MWFGASASLTKNTGSHQHHLAQKQRKNMAPKPLEISTTKIQQTKKMWRLAVTTTLTMISLLSLNSHTRLTIIIVWVREHSRCCCCNYLHKIFFSNSTIESNKKKTIVDTSNKCTKTKKKTVLENGKSKELLLQHFTLTILHVSVCVIVGFILHGF